MTPFGSASVVLNSTQTPLYVCPPGCRVKITGIIFSNTNSGGNASVGLYQSRNGVSTRSTSMRGRPFMGYRRSQAGLSVLSTMKVQTRLTLHCLQTQPPLTRRGSTLPWQAK